MNEQDLTILEDNVVIEEILTTLGDDSNDELIISFYRSLVDKHLVLPVKLNAAEFNNNGSEEDVPVELVTQPSPIGDGEVVIAFTSLGQLESCLGIANYIICRVDDIFELVIQGKLEGLVINPGLEWGGIPTEDIQTFFSKK